ncbi:unnamed protein product [Brassica rapa subsp. trilocularis]
MARKKQVVAAGMVVVAVAGSHPWNSLIQALLLLSLSFPASLGTVLIDPHSETYMAWPTLEQILIRDIEYTSGPEIRRQFWDPQHWPKHVFIRNTC